MPAIRASIRAARLSFAHGDAAPLLEDVHFHLTPGWWGLVGANGAGKSTLLRLCAGRLVPGAGQLRVEPDDARVVLCEQEVDLPPDDAGELAEAEDGAARKLRARLALEPAQLARWPTLSPGQRKRWQIGVALHAQPEVLLLDEPTNHLDAPARAALVAALRGFRGIGVVVAHDRTLLEALGQRTLRVRERRVDVHEGAYERARAAWAAEDAAHADERQALCEHVRAAQARLAVPRRERAGAENLRSTGRRMKDRHDSDARTMAAGNLAAWAEARAGRQVAVVRTQLERAERELAEAAPVPRQLGRSLHVAHAPAPRPVLALLELAELCAGPHVCARDLRVQLRRDDRVHLTGANGAGKSTLLAALLHAARLPSERVLHLAQELGADTARALLAEVRAQGPAERGRTLSLVAALGVDPDPLLASAQPSPGEARKLALALALGRQAWLLALDEPENHLDLPSIERLEAALIDYPGALVLVSHDDAFARRVTTRTWQLAAGLLSET